MVDPRNGWLEIGIQNVVATLVVAIAVMGCAASQMPTGFAISSTVQTIAEVSVSRDGDSSIIRLAGLEDPAYSVATLDDPNLVVVDLVGVDQAEAESAMGVAPDEAQQIAAYDGVIDLVTFSTFEEEGGAPLTRVEIAMADAGQAEVVSTGEGLEIRVSPAGLGGDLDMTAELSPDWADEKIAAEMPDVEPWQTVEDSSDRMDMDDSPLMTTAPVTVSEPLPAATQLTGMSVETMDLGVLVALETNGGIGAIEAFTLEDPARLVVDLMGLEASASAGNISVDSSFVTGIRVGSHEGKVRVVVDGGLEAGGFEGRQVMPGTRGLWVAIGSGEALSRAMNEALAASESTWIASATPDPVEELTPFSEEAAAAFEDTFDEQTETFAAAPAMVGVEEYEEPVEVFEISDAPVEALETGDEPGIISMEAFELTEVYGLHYERANGLDRTAILSDDSVTYTTSAPDATTLVVSIQNAQISEAASDRIFPQAGGPISLIHAFQQPDLEVPEVRVVFTRAPDQAPVVSRRGSMIFVDFADLGAAAAPPPAFPNAGATDEPAPMLASAPAPTEAAMLDELAAFGIEAAEPVEPAAATMAAVSPVPMEADATMSEVPAAAPMEVISGLPSFDDDSGMLTLPPTLDGEAPASIWDAPVSVVAAPAPAPAAVEVPAAIEVLEEGGLIDGKEYRGRRVSLDFKDVAIADVLRLIAEVSDLNIIAGDEVSGNVTIRLVEVPWDQALDVILMTKGLGFVRVGNVLRIAPSDVLKAEEEVRLQERRNKEKLEDLEVKLLPVNYASVKDTEGLIKRLLSARGTVNLDERTNTLIIKDISSVIDEASALIAAIDTQTPQVMIEAKIVEANLDFTRELGSVWGAQTNQFVDAFDPDTPRTDLGSEDLTFIDSNSLAFGNPITAVPTGLLTMGALILDQDFRVDVQIQAAESTGDGKVVSSPRIVTLDNKEARIEQGVSIPFQTFEGGDAKLEFIDAVLSLVVTPHITADESIIMEIEVTRNAPDGTVPTPTGSPAISKNVAETETLVKDGQTLVLGGIYTITKSKTQSRVPYLHRIPVIGNAFKSNNVIDNRKELLVFVTPRIVRLPEMASN
ncbi:MAG: hypothetical protein CL933_17510 [Deltaproteobacteria bacterium]|nr:hypothetical protein [Deltaproteobacteria bacterium]